MCDCDLDRPVVWEEAKRKAKKQHVCCECDKTINPGEEYIWMKGLWDSRWRTHKMCLGCDALAKATDLEGCYELRLLHYTLAENGDSFAWDDETETWPTDDPSLEIVCQHPLCIVIRQQAGEVA